MELIGVVDPSQATLSAQAMLPAAGADTRIAARSVVGAGRDR